MNARISKQKNRRIGKASKLRNLSNIRRLPSVGGHPMRRYMAMLNMARKEQYFGPFMILPSEQRASSVPVGIFKLTGKGRGKRGGGQITMIRTFETRVKIKAHSYIGAGSRFTLSEVHAIYNEKAKWVLRRYKFRNKRFSGR